MNAPRPEQGQPPDVRQDELLRSVARRRRRRLFFQRFGERHFTRNLALIGSLGWLIATPTVLGAFAGRWLDRQLESGIFWSASLIFCGAALGLYLAWKRMEREQKE